MTKLRFAIASGLASFLLLSKLRNEPSSISQASLSLIIIKTTLKMKLNQEQQNLLIAKLNAIWKNKVCEICGTNHWTIDDTIYQVNEYHGNNIIFGSGSVVPVMNMTCNNCGNTKFLNAIKLGLVNQESNQNTNIQNRQDVTNNE